MGRFVFEKTSIEGLFVVNVQPFADDRGYFFESYNENDFKNAGLDMKFVQCNESMSSKGVLRGLHFQKTHPQGKLVRCVLGEVFDVAVDLRRNSSTFGRWFGVVLSENNFKQFYIPEGFAHGFYVLSERAKFQYMVTDFYLPNDEGSCLWNDSDIGVRWPIDENCEVFLSEKDAKAPRFCELKNLKF